MLSIEAKRYTRVSSVYLWQRPFTPGKGVGLYDYWHYEGDWKNHLINGKGKYLYHGGSYYTREMKDNIRHGHGKLVLKDSTAYKGEWKNDKLNGKGKPDKSKVIKTLWLPNGDKRTCNFVDGKLEGEVTVYTKATNTTTTFMYKKGVAQ